MKNFISLFLLVSLFACDRESVSEKTVNAKYKSIQRKWQFVSMETVGMGADSARVAFASASVDWGNTKCKYTDEDGNYNYCAGNGVFNSMKMSYYYGYDVVEGKYLLRISPSGEYTNDTYELTRKFNALFNGLWEFEVIGETLTARQVSNEILPGVLTTLKAKAL